MTCIVRITTTARIGGGVALDVATPGGITKKLLGLGRAAKPKVDGAVVQLKPIDNYNKINFNNLEKLLEQSFSSRRKKIKNTLRMHKKSLTKLNIDENLRPENLSVSNYCELVKLIN